MFRTLSLMTAAAVAFAAPANAQTVVERVSVKVADLNLNSAEDRAELRDRVEVAVRAACTRGENSRLIRRTVDRACMAEARNEAMARLASLTPQRDIAAGN